MKIKIIRANGESTTVDSEKKGEPTFNEKARWKKQSNTHFTVVADLPNGNGLNNDLKKEVTEKVINKDQDEQLSANNKQNERKRDNRYPNGKKKEQKEENYKINKDGIIVPEEEKEVVEVNKDLADKLVESMTTSDEDKDIMTKKIMEQYGLEPGNDQSGLEDEEDPINEY